MGKSKYTLEQQNKLIELFNSGTPIPEISAIMELPQRSVTAKLSNLKLYKRQPYKTKQGLLVVTKTELIDSLAQTLDCDAQLLESLEKCNKSVLQLLVKKLVHK